jgi:hypothetical protein
LVGDRNGVSADRNKHHKFVAWSIHLKSAALHIGGMKIVKLVPILFGIVALPGFLDGSRRATFMWLFIAAAMVLSSVAHIALRGYERSLALMSL